jgi:hypothetical protein
MCLSCYHALSVVSSMWLFYPTESSLRRPASFSANVQSELSCCVCLFEPPRLHSGAAFRWARFWELTPAFTTGVPLKRASRCRKTGLAHLGSYFRNFLRWDFVCFQHMTRILLDEKYNCPIPNSRCVRFPNMSLSASRQRSACYRVGRLTSGPSTRLPSIQLLPDTIPGLGSLFGAGGENASLKRAWCSFQNSNRSSYPTNSFGSAMVHAGRVKAGRRSSTRRCGQNFNYWMACDR